MEFPTDIVKTIASHLGYFDTTNLCEVLQGCSKSEEISYMERLSDILKASTKSAELNLDQKTDRELSGLETLYFSKMANYQEIVLKGQDYESSQKLLNRYTSNVGPSRSMFPQHSFGNPDQTAEIFKPLLNDLVKPGNVIGVFKDACKWPEYIICFYLKDNILKVDYHAFNPDIGYSIGNLPDYISFLKVLPDSLANILYNILLYNNILPFQG